jgi:hypothetical protein
MSRSTAATSCTSLPPSTNDPSDVAFHATWRERFAPQIPEQRLPPSGGPVRGRTMIEEHSLNNLLVEAPRKLLRQVRSKLKHNPLGASRVAPIDVRDWHTGLHVRYAVADDVGDQIDSLASLWPEAKVELRYDYPDQDWSGVARWVGGVMFNHETDDPTVEANDRELYREGILVTSQVDDYDSAVLSSSRWAAVCRLARGYGWSPEAWVSRALDAATDPIDDALAGRRDLGFVEIELTMLPTDEALRLAAALDAAIDAYGVPADLQDRLGIRRRVTASRVADAAPDSYDRATPRFVRGVRDIAAAGAEMRVARLIRSDRSAG